ncbi:MAG: DUF1016 domain-containing protein [Chlorobi bacterium]|nr:DUF1016 domain-containing protein [Chlorobiota bacterium]
MKQFYIEFPILQTVFAKSDNQKLQTLFAKSEKEDLQEDINLFSKKLTASITHLTWSHFVRLLSIKDEEERSFYIIETAENKWSERELNRQINSSLFERLVLNKDKKAVKELSEKGQIISTEQDLLKDPLVLEFLNIKQNSSYSEHELETAIINNLGEFLMNYPAASGRGSSFFCPETSCQVKHEVVGKP